MSKQTASKAEAAGAKAAETVDNVHPMEPVKKKVDQAKRKVAAAVDEAREKLHDAAADVGEKFQHASAVAQEKSRRAREAARERYQVASAQLQDGYSRVRKDVDYMVDDVNDFVRAKPGTSILIAAAAGFLLGLLLRPRGRYDG